MALPSLVHSHVLSIGLATSLIALMADNAVVNNEQVSVANFVQIAEATDAIEFGVEADFDMLLMLARDLRTHKRDPEILKCIAALDPDGSVTRDRRSWLALANFSGIGSLSALLVRIRLMASESRTPAEALLYRLLVIATS